VKRTLFLLTNILLLIALSAVYAAEANQLDIYGVAYVTDWDLSGDDLPIFPILWPNGSYFYSANLPAALTQGDEDWIGSTFHLDIVKPPSVSNNGQNQFTMQFQIINPTNYQWTNGQASAVIVSGIYSTVGATLSTTTVGPEGMVTITFSFKTKIDITSTDEAHITVSFEMAGKRRYFYIDIIMRPV